MDDSSPRRWFPETEWQSSRCGVSFPSVNGNDAGIGNVQKPSTDNHSRAANAQKIVNGRRFPSRGYTKKRVAFQRPASHDRYNRRLQFRTGSHQGFAFFVAGELREVLDETTGQIFGFYIPIGCIGIGLDIVVGCHDCHSPTFYFYRLSLLFKSQRASPTVLLEVSAYRVVSPMAEDRDDLAS